MMLPLHRVVLAVLFVAALAACGSDEDVPPSLATSPRAPVDGPPGSTGPTTAPDLGTGPFGAPIHLADTPCVNSRPDEAGATEPHNDIYLDDREVTWAVAEPEDEGLDGQLLRQGLEEAGRAPTLLSVLMVRHGRLVVEEYYHGAKASHARNLHSATKSLLGLLVGAAISDGFLPGIDTPIGDLVAEAKGTQVGAVTVEQLLSMSGGLAQVKEPYLVRDVVALPLTGAPGERWEYNDAGSELVALALERHAPGGLCRYAHQVLGPLGVTIDHWHENPDGGVTGRAYAFMTSRELARIGQLVLQSGQWDGRQIIPADWFDTMLEPRYDIDGGPYRGPGACIGTEEGRAYGLHWRIFEIDGHTAWTAAGYGGQFIVVVPSLDLVAVVTHDTYHDVVMPVQRHLSPHQLIEYFVLQGIDGAAAPHSACARDLYRARIDGSDPRPLVAYPATALAPEWSPDGSRIAFQSSRDLNVELYVMNADGSEVRRLTEDWAVDALPRWSPDGTRLAFLSDRNGSSFDVHVLDLATGETHGVTPALGDVSGFTWSPDGTEIAFVRSTAGGVGELWRVGVDGSDPSLVSPGPVGWPSWSPDGRRIAVVTGVDTGIDGEGVRFRIGLLDVSTGALTDLGTGTDVPTWTADGHNIVTNATTETGPALVYIDRETGARTTVDAVPGGRPSPDGRWVVYSQATR